MASIWVQSYLDVDFDVLEAGWRFVRLVNDVADLVHGGILSGLFDQFLDPMQFLSHSLGLPFVLPFVAGAADLQFLGDGVPCVWHSFSVLHFPSRFQVGGMRSELFRQSLGDLIAEFAQGVLAAGEQIGEPFLVFWMFSGEGVGLHEISGEGVREPFLGIMAIQYAEPFVLPP